MWRTDGKAVGTYLENRVPKLLNTNSLTVEVFQQEVSTFPIST